MPKDNDGNPSSKNSRDGLPLPSSSDLRGRQSVRATFRLSQRAIHAISVVSVHLGIKQKSLFDHLIDDPVTLELVADEIRSDDFRNLERVQKTFVISRRTLSCLEDAARIRGAPRDALVEYSIQRLIPVINRERERHPGEESDLFMLREKRFGGSRENDIRRCANERRKASHVRRVRYRQHQCRPEHL